MPPPVTDEQRNDFNPQKDGTLLHYAARIGAPTLIDSFVSADIIPLNAVNSYRQTPLDSAALAEQKEAFFRLLELHNQRCEDEQLRLAVYDQKTLERTFNIFHDLIFRNKNIKSLLNGLLGSFCPAAGLVGYYQSTCFIIGKFTGANMPFWALNTTSWACFVFFVGMFSWANYYTNQLDADNRLREVEYSIIRAQIALAEREVRKTITQGLDAYSRELTVQVHKTVQKTYIAVSKVNIPPARIFSHPHQKARDYLCYKDHIAVATNLYVNNFLCTLTGTLLALSLLVVPWFSSLNNGDNTLLLKLIDFIVAILLAILVLCLIYFTSQNEQLSNISASIKQNATDRLNTEKFVKDKKITIENQLRNNNIPVPNIEEVPQDDVNPERNLTGWRVRLLSSCQSAGEVVKVGLVSVVDASRFSPAGPLLPL